MEYTPPLTRNGTTFELDPASELSDLPPTLHYLANQASGAWSTAERAKKTLQVTSTNTGDRWTWQLPAAIPISAIPNLEAERRSRCAGAETRIPNSPSSSSTKNQVPSTETTTCAPPPQTEAQIQSSPQDTPPHPIPARTCAPVPETVAQSPPTAVPALVPGAGPEGRTATPTPEPCPPPGSSSTPSSLNHHSDIIIRMSQRNKAPNPQLRPKP